MPLLYFPTLFRTHTFCRLPLHFSFPAGFDMEEAVQDGVLTAGTRCSEPLPCCAPRELALPKAFLLHCLIHQLPHSTTHRSPSQVKYNYHIDFCLPAFYRDVLGWLQSLLQYGSSIALSITLSSFCSGLNCSCFSLLSPSTNSNFFLQPETQPLSDTDE